MLDISLLPDGQACPCRYNISASHQHWNSCMAQTYSTTNRDEKSFWAFCRLFVQPNSSTLPTGSLCCCSTFSCLKFSFEEYMKNLCRDVYCLLFLGVNA